MATKTISRKAGHVATVEHVGKMDYRVTLNGKQEARAYRDLSSAHKAASRWVEIAAQGDEWGLIPDSFR